MAPVNSFSRFNMVESLPPEEDETRKHSSVEVRSPQEELEPTKRTFPKGAVILDKNGKP